MSHTSKIVGVTQAVVLCCMLAACANSNSPSFDSEGSPFGVMPGAPLLNSKVETATSTAPVVGGTLMATRDGGTIVAADPDRDTVFLVNASSRSVTPVALQTGDEPGRVIEGPAGTVFVALRRAGALATIDSATGAVTSRTPVCSSPRGLAYDAASASLYVACRSGLLLTLDASDLSVKRSLTLDPDLRDVIVRDRDLVITRYLSAEVMVVAADGTVSRRATPQPTPGCATATVLSRALSLPNGQIALAHQLSSDDTVSVDNGGYGSNSCGSGLVTRVVTRVDVDTASTVPVTNTVGVTPIGNIASATGTVTSSMTFQSQFLPAAGPLDIAVDPASGQLAAIALDTSLTAASASTGPAVGAPNGPGTIISTTPGASLWLAPLNAFDSSGIPTPATLSVAIKGQPIAVAFNAGSYIVQSREPAALQFQDGTSVRLSDQSVADTGHLLFHMDSGIGISCSSCHPEGGEDGHVWHFPEGLRRTLPLEGGVLERAPFHWDGTLPDMNALFSEVMVKRMSMRASVSDAQVASLGAFLERLPEPPPADGLDASAVQRGASLFRRTDVGCITCHGGAQYTNNQLEDVGTGGQFVTPSLLGVGLRSPLFHDGCAKSIDERFGPCGGTDHGKAALLSAAEQSDLIAFLRSL